MEYSEIASKIIKYVGGEENIISFMNCITRLRIEVTDKKKINKDELSKIEKVKGVSVIGSICQVVLLDEVMPVTEALGKQVTITAEAKKKNLLEIILDYLSNVFVPIIPALMAGGLLQGFMALVNHYEWVAPGSSSAIILDVMGHSVLYFYPVMIAFSAAKYMKSNPFIAAMIALVLVHPDFAALMTSGERYVSLLGLPVRATAYNNTVFPVLLMVPFISVVEKWMNKIVPNTVKTFVAPFLVLIIATPICLVAIAPVGAFMSDGFTSIFNWLNNSVPWLAGIIVGSLASLFVMTGLHVVIVLITIANLVAIGTDTLWPILVLSTVILGGVSVGAALRLKNKEEKSFARSAAGLAFLFGLSEPCLYGVVIRYKRPFVPMIASGAVVGALSSILGVKATALGSGIFGLPVFFTTLVPFVICYVVAVVLSAAMTYFYGVEKPNKKLPKADLSEAETA